MRWILICLSVLGLLVVQVGCGGGDSDSARTTASRASASGPESPPPPPPPPGGRPGKAAASRSRGGSATDQDRPAQDEDQATDQDESDQAQPRARPARRRAVMAPADEDRPAQDEDQAADQDESDQQQAQPRARPARRRAVMAPADEDQPAQDEDQSDQMESAEDQQDQSATDEEQPQARPKRAAPAPKSSKGGTMGGLAEIAAAMLGLRPSETPIPEAGTSRSRQPANGAEGKLLPGAGKVARPPGSELLQKAEQALAKGNQKLGLACLQADAVARGDEAVLASLRWSAALKRPMLMVRWGVAVQSTVPRALTAPKPAAVDPSRASRYGKRKKPGGRENGEGRSSAGSEDPMQYWSQAVGLPLLASLESRMAEGKFGQWLQTDKQSGAPTRFAADDSGEARDDRPMISQSGIAIFPSGDQEQLRHRAFREGVDLLAVAVIGSKGVRSGGQTEAQTSCLLRVFDVAKKEPLWTSKSMERTRRDNVAGSAVELLSEFAEFVDKQITLTDLPPLPPDAVRNRANKLVDPPPSNPFPVLMELRFYQSKRLLTPEELSGYYTKIIGAQDGPRLATGTEAERKQIVQRWLEKVNAEPKSDVR